MAEDKIKELSKQIHSRKLLLDDHTDRLQKNLHMIKRKEEATVAAREEIKTQTLREMQLQSEVRSENTDINILTQSLFLVYHQHSDTITISSLSEC